MITISFEFMWLLGGFLLVFMELVSPGLFYFLSPAVGMFAAALSAYWGNNFTYQLGLFAFVSLSIFLLLNRWVKKNQKDSSVESRHSETNVYALLGRHALVIVTLSHDKVGQVQVMGQVWSARAEAQETIEKGSTVVIKKVVGVTVLVEKIG